MKKRKKMVSAVSVLALVLLVGLCVGLFMLVNPGKPGEYTGYRSAMMPLTSLSGGENVTVRREVTLDFAPYAREEYRLDDWIDVTDSYLMTNPTGEDVTVELVWGNMQSFSQPSPVITVAGQNAQAELYPSTDPDTLVWNAASYAEYAGLLTENDYLGEAMSEVPEWDAPGR